MVGDARAFLDAARLVEHHISALNVTPHSTSPIYGDKGWPSSEVWMSLKTASHFNLQNALELGFKAFLGSVGQSFANTHRLKGLYSQIPDKEKRKVNALFKKASEECPAFQLIALIRSKEPPKGPQNIRLRGLKEFLEYFDKDVALWNKRYSWEDTSQEKWTHYLDKLDVFLVFLDKLEALNIENWKKTNPDG